ncbi:hypothetical protein L873DRAFT_1451122 [Choiromyces venosus 120613-1]|uniref:Uncharacterized protein n=1 Tax=Choiromyces venosus 120613-1 TaxID=1336337 RepID=A0A3N4KE40_9PEZI|nr:hypothetical protein L873DRAFT_1451122 [Choiromyces venosus 120613-1]
MILTRLCQECLRQPIFCGSPHQIPGLRRRHSWQRRVSSGVLKKKKGREKKKILPLLRVNNSSHRTSRGRVEAGHLIPVLIDERLIGLHSTRLLRTKYGTDMMELQLTSFTTSFRHP